MDYWKQKYIELLNDFGSHLERTGTDKEIKIGANLKENARKLGEVSDENCYQKS